MPNSKPYYYNITLTLTNKFLKWAYTHRLIDGPGKFQDEAFAKRPDVEQIRFGGKYGTQFTTLDEIESFNVAFDVLLDKFKVDKKHKHPLLYLISFLNQDFEQQSIENNRHNYLHDYAVFILDMIADSLAHIERMRKNSNYQEIYDAVTNEILFAKKEVFNVMPLEELVERVPDAKHADDIVRYQRISLYDYELYVPDDVIITIQSNKKRNLKSLSGKQVSLLQLPTNLAYQTFSFIVTNILDQHKKYNTSFYQDMFNPESTLRDFKSFNNKYKKHSISNNTSLARLGTLIGDYLIMNNICTNKRAIAAFLFEYFALFKAINLKKAVEFPNDYSELIHFYNCNHITSETIRYMMNDVGEI